MPGRTAPSNEPLTPPGAATRRDFMCGAGATAAGAVLLNGLLTGVARADKPPKKGPKRPTCVAIFPTAEGAVLTSDDDGKLTAYSFGSKSTVKEFRKQHDGKASFVSVAARARRVATAGYDGKVVIRDPFGSDAPTVLDTHHGTRTEPEVWVAVLNDDASRVMLGTNDGQMQLWDVNARRKLWSFKFSADPVAGLAFLGRASGRTKFLSTHDHGVINEWEIPDNPPLIQPEPVRAFSHDTDFPVNAVVVSRDLTTMVSGSFDTSVRVWDLKAPADPPTPLHVLSGHNNYVWRVAISPDKKRAASASQDGTVKVWDIASESVSRHFNVGPFGSMGVAFAGDDAIAFTGDGTDPTKVINFETFAKNEARDSAR